MGLVSNATLAVGGIKFSYLFQYPFSMNHSSHTCAPSAPPRVLQGLGGRFSVGVMYILSNTFHAKPHVANPKSSQGPREISRSDWEALREIHRKGAGGTPRGVPGGPQAPGGPLGGNSPKGRWGYPQGSPGILGIPWGEFTESPLGVPSRGVSSGPGGTPQRPFGEFGARLMVLNHVL